MNERDLFIQALEKGSVDERRSFLDQACGDDVQLRNRLELLLKAHDDADSLLDHPVLGSATTEAVSGPTDQPKLQTPEVDMTYLGFLERSDQPDALGRLGQYEMREVVGRGGMGIVFRAEDTKLNRVVAVKVLAPELAANATARKRFLREAKAAAAVSHDHVVTIYAVADNDTPQGSRYATGGGLPYLVMEFIDGQSLEQKINRVGQLDLKEILRIGRQIAAGLAAAHRQGLIHRDIKPSNILLQNGIERVKITDFGLARAADDISITRPGEVTGTPQYMSPEQAHGHPVDARSDLFSLGIVLYSMCTGRPPFRADTAMATLKRVCEDTPRPIREINADVPEWLADLTNRLLEKDADERFQSADEVRQILDECLAHVQDPDTNRLPPVLPDRSVTNRKRTHAETAMVSRRRRWAVVAAALIVAFAFTALSEATGVTKLAETVIRIAMGNGTLVIEVDDPTVQFLIDGQKLGIRGAGIKELTLRPGQYQLQAVKEGLPVMAELLSITRGGRKVVRISSEVNDLHRQSKGASSPSLTQGDGWCWIFDGKSLDDWEANLNPGCWTVADGAIRGQGGPSYLFYREPVGDFECRAEVKINRRGNSGLYFHARKEPTGPSGGLIEGEEIQIIGSELWDKGGTTFTGSYFGATSVLENPIRDNEWFTMHVAVRKGVVRVWIDDRQVLQVLDRKWSQKLSDSPGYLALQTWGQDTEVCFRQIALRQIDTDPL